ncbi:hypothetical protein JKF63_00229 [Porcisia hertigi]|uniref:Uncharacterized protein n=1 Tax=Porcisia hertigi TaxID=2761500 RepID=A0A836HT93_9TRYP|nr:hypothetical protein JKF63_00229 [Porcisia hertigi]
MILLIFICGMLWMVWSIASFFMYRPRQISGSTVVVTGACSDIGRHLCLQLYARGARVIAWDYSKIKLQELQSKVLKTTERVDHLDSASVQDDDRVADSLHSRFFVCIAVDVTSRLQVQRAVKELDGPVDIIVNAAHMYPLKGLSGRTDDSAERVIQTNLLSPLMVVRQLLPLLLARDFSSNAGGLLKATQRRDDYAQVVNVVSASASYSLSPHSPEYAASQWGMVGMHYSMREWIAQQRNEYMTDGVSIAASGKKKMVAATSPPPRLPREVRTTLLYLNEIQHSASTLMSSPLSSSSGMTTVVRVPSPTTQSSSPESLERDGDGGTGARKWSASAYSDSYIQVVQKRNAELEKAAICCVNAICRGQESYCYTSAWASTIVYPLLIACPVPWATRLLRWMQRRPTAATEN